MENIDKSTILVVDDEENICEILQYNLQKSGYLVDVAHSGEEALTLIKSKRYNLLLLDIMLGGISGIGLAQLLREDYNDNTPIIFLSALDTEPDILRGFKSGGDDYIAKPFSINQVIARVGAVLKRFNNQAYTTGINTNNNNSNNSSNSSNNNNNDNKNNNSHNDTNNVNERIQCGNLTIKIDELKVYIDNNEIALTKTEFNILKLLSINANKIVPRETILKNVWQGNIFVTERTVDVHIARLRKKIDTSNAKIVNRSGYGYSLEQQSENKKENS